MDVFSKRVAIVRTVADEKNVDAKLIGDLLALETEFANLHAYGARPRLRRAAEKLIDAALVRQDGASGG